MPAKISIDRSDSSEAPGGPAGGSPTHSDGSSKLRRESRSTAELLLAAVDTASSGFSLLRNHLSSEVFVDPGRLRTMRALGEGAFGRTHRAELAPEGAGTRRGRSSSRGRGGSARLRPRDVAVKTLRRELLEDGETVRRFPELWGRIGGYPLGTACTCLFPAPAVLPRGHAVLSIEHASQRQCAPC